ncbi:MAG: cob(I)yrinic acid a,c-diamide adenosyltransferase [Bacillota bacterium]|nr:cob(I)yrinic acid a,c-diamide adenosyltransferase [Bacillota bacterium]
MPRARIYTRTGDTGETSLVDGSRVRKSSPRVEAYGSVDELNAALGVVLSLEPGEELAPTLRRVQGELFVLGARLAAPAGGARAGSAARVAGLPTLPAQWVEVLEREIDRLEETLPPLDHFILPGGGPAGAWLHLARTICRRAERAVIRLGEEEPVEPEIRRYLNRLSDYLFVAARAVNHRQGRAEIAWRAGAGAEAGEPGSTGA